ncbi:MAG: hypothetical protein KJ936_03220 [Proteobacteria bacterium]|nr:hypothetical protein [Pseudomonadota bacterium]MBU2226669.1 hypothetical protein [Pseudomonadota bacterium]MBU2261070.1 hypothetical protein [Pseudomonadota bacterium]
MKKCIFLFIVVSFIIGGCATTSLKQDYPTGKRYRDVFVLEDKRIPLPEGEWKIVGTGTTDMGKYSEVFLLKETNNHKFAGGVIIVSDTIMNNYVGYIQNTYAERKDHHYVSIKSNTRTERLDLWLVNHYIFSFTPGQRDASKEFLQYLIDNKISVPKLMVRSYHIITGKMLRSRYLRVEYYYNPEIEGFDLSREDNWGTSSWHIMKIASDPKKVAYVENVKKQGEIFHGKIREWFQY